jgi:hypothetical protein
MYDFLARKIDSDRFDELLKIIKMVNVLPILQPSIV